MSLTLNTNASEQLRTDVKSWGAWGGWLNFVDDAKEFDITIFCSCDQLADLRDKLTNFLRVFEKRRTCVSNPTIPIKDIQIVNGSRAEVGKELNLEEKNGDKS